MEKHVKENTPIPADFKIKKCPPANAVGASLNSLTRKQLREERAAFRRENQNAKS